MFAFGGVKVIVLPQLEHWQAFPASLHSSQCELSALWGYCGVGSTTGPTIIAAGAPFSCALKAEIIANLDDPDVLLVLNTRAWPQNVAEY